MMRIKTFSIFLLLFAACTFAIGFRSAASAPAASVVSVSLPGPEGAEGSPGQVVNFNFTIRRVNDLATVCTVNYETRDGSYLNNSSPGALAPEDYQYNSGSLIFAAGEESKVVTVRVVSDSFFEQTENFSLNLTSASGCTIGTTSATAFILDDDSPPGPLPGCGNRGVEGDATFDAAIRVDDLVRMRRAVLGMESESHLLYACEFQNLDINRDCGDGLVNSADVTVLRQWILTGGGQRPSCGPIGPPFPF